MMNVFGSPSFTDAAKTGLLSVFFFFFFFCFDHLSLFVDISKNYLGFLEVGESFLKYCSVVWEKI